jgi:predicted DNA binding CopG/RHH family protein
MNQAIKPIPKFKNENEERAFWANHSMVDYMQEITKPISFPNLKPSTKTISLRLPQELLDTIKTEAHRRDIPYQTFMKAKLYELFRPYAQAA